MAHLTLGVLGALHVTLPDGSTAKFPSDKTRALLAYLAVEADRPHRRDTLLGLLWPDEPEATARHNLRQALFSLRQAIRDSTAQPPYLYITRDEIQFNATSNSVVDVASFDAHLAACTSHPHARLDSCDVCAPRLQQAVDLYRGKFLQEFFLGDSAEFEEWAVARREGLHQRALEALIDLATYYEHRGDLSATRRCASRQLELDPWREQAHRQMMRVLALDGQYGAALAQYEKCRHVLAEELGVEPSSETRELYEQIRAGRLTSAGGSWNEHARGAPGLQFSASEAKPPTFTLPAPLTSFIGRERELADLGQFLADPACRCITLVGPGGIGKTRLALQTAANHRHEFAHGVVFVSLAAIESAEAIVPAIAETLGFSFYGPTSPRVQLFDHLRDSQMLLVLDNVEQLLVEGRPQGNAADVLMDLLHHTTEIKLLLTSRQVLNVQGEWVFEVGGLQTPEEGGSEAIESAAAVTLFLQRAQHARVSYALATPDRGQVARLCRLVDGNPLALELAATWVRTLSVSEIVTELERSLDFLTASVRDLPERHRSIRAVFDHSWEMLSPEEQGVLRDMSVFHGRFQRQAAEQVAGASLATLSSLVAKSLVRRTATGHYDLHELVRQYAASKLASDALASTVAEQHSRYYLNWLSRSAPRLRDHRQKDAVTELAAEVDNLRAAWDWAITHHDIARAYQVSADLLYLYELRTWFAEGEMLFRRTAAAIQSLGTQGESNADALLAINVMRAHSAYFTFRLGKSDASYAALVPCAKYLQSSTDELAGTFAGWYLGMVSWELGKFAEAIASFEASLETARACHARWYETMDVEYLGIVAHDQGEYDRARRYFTEALASAREIGDPMIISHGLGYMSLTTLALGEITETETLLHESLALAEEIEYRSGIGNALDRLGLLAQITSPEDARFLFMAGGHVFRENGDLRNVSRVLCHLGNNALAVGDAGAAQRSFLEALRLAREGGYAPFALNALLGLATIGAKSINPERALELVFHVLQHPAATHDTKSRAERLRAELESQLTPQQIQAAQTQAQKRSFGQVVRQILEQISSS